MIFLRVISGIYGGRQLLMDDKLPIRPTSDKARGAIFSSLADRIPDASFLDVFAGTGAVSIEALSRGAKTVTMIEKSPRVAALINRNLHNLGISKDQVTLCIGDFERELVKLAGRAFDIIFADPPYSKGYPSMVIELVAEHNLLCVSGVLVVEHFTKEGITDKAGDVGRVKEKHYGQTTMSFFLRG